MPPYLVQEHLWKTKDGKIVHDGDPRSAFLFATPGMVLPEKPHIEGEEAIPFASLRGAKTAKAVKPDEDKAIKPSEDKAIKPRKNK